MSLFLYVAEIIEQGRRNINSVLNLNTVALSCMM